MLENVSLAIGLASAAYLTGRAAAQVVRQSRSYRELPFPDGPFEIPAALDRAAGAMLGVAVGDAMGAAREMIPPAIARMRYGAQPSLSRGVFRFMRRRGTVTDDTQHTLLVARAVSPSGFDAKRFAQSLVDWRPWAIGPGRGTLTAIDAIAKGKAVLSESEGNGAAMRIAPLVVAFHHDPQMLEQAVRACAAVTHPADRAIEAAVLVAQILRSLLVEEPLPEHEWLRDATVVRSTGWAVDTVSSAYALWRDYGTHWQAGLASLYRVGGDTDTVGSIYTSFVGAAAGASVFGTELLGSVQGTGVLLREVERLAAE